MPMIQAPSCMCGKPSKKAPGTSAAIQLNNGYYITCGSPECIKKSRGIKKRRVHDVVEKYEFKQNRRHTIRSLKGEGVCRTCKAPARHYHCELHKNVGKRNQMLFFQRPMSLGNPKRTNQAREFKREQVLKQLQAAGIKVE